MALPKKYEGLVKTLEIVGGVLADIFGAPGSVPSIATWALEKSLEMFPPYTLKTVLNRISFSSLGLSDDQYDFVYEQTRIALNCINSENYNPSVFSKEVFTKNSFNPVTIADELIVSLELGEEEKSDVLKAVRFVLAVYLLHWTEDPCFPLETRQQLQSLDIAVNKIRVEIDMLKKDTSNIKSQINELKKSGNKHIPTELTMIPNSVASLIGRNNEVHEIINKINSDHIVCLCADGGLGKTTLAKYIINEIRHKAGKDNYSFQHVAWITSSGKMKEDLLQIKIITSEEGNSNEKPFDKINLFLKSNPTFIVIDNMDDAPTNEDANLINTISGTSSLLITTRAIIDGFPFYMLPPLNRDDSVILFYYYYFRNKDITSLEHDLLRAEKENGQIEIVYRIADATGGNALLIELIAKTAHADAMSIAELWETLSTNIFGLESKTEVYTDHSDKYQESKLSIDEQIRRLYSMLKLSEKQREILSFISLFPAEQAIFTDVFKWAGFFANGANDIQDLVDKGWIVRGEDYYLIHTIVRESICMQNKESETNFSILKYETLIEKLTDIDDYIPDTMDSNLARQRASIPQTVGSLLYETNTSNVILGDFFHNLADLFHKQGNNKDSLKYYKRALEIRKALLGKNHPDTGTTYNNMAGVYYDLGNYSDALSYYNKAIKVFRKTLGVEDHNLSLIYNNLAAIYSTQGSYNEAFKYYSKAIDLNEDTLTVGFISTAKLYNNFAGYYLSQNKYADALTYYKKALEIYNKALGNNHPDTASAYNNIAQLYQDQGNYQEALKFFEMALKTYEKTLGKNHPDTATAYNSIASLYQNQGNYQKALKIFEMALKTYEKTLGKDHPQTAMAFSNIADVYANLGNYEEALKFYNIALKIREKILGKDHPSTATTFNNLALIFYRKGNFNEALNLYNMALEICMKTLGEKHPYTASIYNNLALVLKDTREYSKALMHFEKALFIKKDTLGKYHPDTASTYINIADIYQILGKYDEARNHYQTALEIQLKTLGTHPDTATTYEKLAELHLKMGNIEESKRCITKAREIRKKLGGE